MLASCVGIGLLLASGDGLPEAAAAGVDTASGPSLRLADEPAFELTADDAITAVLVRGRTVYIGGLFEQLSRFSGSLAIVSASGEVRERLPVFGGGDVHAIVDDGSGGWLVGGAFTTVAGQSCPGLAHVRSDGSFDGSWCPSPVHERSGEPGVLALVRREGTLYVGGYFTRIGDVRRARLAAVDIATGTVTDWNPGVWGIPAYDRNLRLPRSVDALATAERTLFVGGFFNRVAGRARANVAALDAVTGALSSWNPGVTAGPRRIGATVRAIVVSGRQVFLGGSFARVGGRPGRGIAAVHLASGSVLPWRTTLKGHVGYGTVGALALAGRTLYLGGEFGRVGGLARTGVAAVDTLTGEPTAFASRLSARITTAKVDAFAFGGGVLYLAGSFDEVDGRRQPQIAAVDPGTGLVQAWSPEPNGSVLALATAGSNVVLGGQFSGLGGWPRDGLAAIDARTGVPTEWNPHVQGVNALGASETVLYVGGSFERASGQERAGLASYLLDSGELIGWNPGLGGGYFGAEAIAVVGPTVYLGGDFERAAGVEGPYLTAVDGLTGAALPWTVRPDGPVEDLVASGDALYIAGFFDLVDGQLRRRLAAIDIRTGTVSPWDPDPEQTDRSGAYGGDVETLAASETRLFVGGVFDTIAGAPRSGLVAFDLGTGGLTSWRADPAPDEVCAAAPVGSTIYVAAGYETDGSGDRAELTGFDLATGAGSAPARPTRRQVRCEAERVRDRARRDALRQGLDGLPAGIARRSPACAGLTSLVERANLD